MNTPSDTKALQDACSILLDSLAVAYVRPVVTDKGKSYAVCAADGTQLAMFATEDAAYFAAKQHDLEPVLIH
ncbi:MAG: DUF1150 family protein [Pseudomonadota bacterium]|nr:DUF1150 family protein [Pseudomonadota bacterium]